MELGNDNLIDRCPRCGSGNVLTVADPVRKLRKGSLHHENGDCVKHSCAFCGWWSKCTYSKTGKRTGVWQWKVCPDIKTKEKQRIKDRIRKIEHKIKNKSGLKK